MQFTPEIESMIAAAVAKGGVTQEDNAAITRAALIAGIDPNDVANEVNSRIAAAQQAAAIARAEAEQKAAIARAEAEEAARRTARRKESGKHGDIRKCPACGAEVAATAVRCPECGHEFVGIDAVSSVKQLAEKLNKTKRDDEKMDFIRMFPVPNAKEDIIEFLAMAAPNARKKGGFLGSIGGRLVLVAVVTIVIGIAILLLGLASDASSENTFACCGVFMMMSAMVLGMVSSGVDTETLRHNKFAKVWQDKFDQVMMKARTLRADAEFTRQLDYFQSQLDK